jgi:hypothetical protein
VCINCTTADRLCDYPKAGGSPTARTTNANSSASGVIPPSNGTSGPLEKTPTNDGGSTESNASPKSSPVNVLHLELFSNFSAGTLFIPDAPEEIKSLADRFIVQTSLSTPYLLYAMMALSARQLAVTGQSERRELYRLQAIELQNYAISSFSSFSAPPAPAVTKDDAVSMLLFSSCIARHSLADVLVNAKQCKDLDSFLDRYVEYARVHRGVATVYMQYAHFIQDSELLPLSRWANKRLLADDEEFRCGQETASIRALLTSSSQLDAVDVHECMEALKSLQTSLSQIHSGKDSPGNSNWLHNTFNWNLLVPQRYNELLVERRPEAIAILAYYFVLLHHGRHAWQVGDCGAWLLNRAVEYLGPEWESWLAWPRAAVAKDSEAEME